MVDVNIAVLIVLLVAITVLVMLALYLMPIARTAKVIIEQPQATKFTSVIGYDLFLVLLLLGYK